MHVGAVLDDVPIFPVRCVMVYAQHDRVRLVLQKESGDPDPRDDDRYIAQWHHLRLRVFLIANGNRRFRTEPRLAWHEWPPPVFSEAFETHRLLFLAAAKSARGRRGEAAVPFAPRLILLAFHPGCVAP